MKKLHRIIFATLLTGLVSSSIVACENTPAVSTARKLNFQLDLKVSVTEENGIFYLPDLDLERPHKLFRGWSINSNDTHVSIKPTTIIYYEDIVNLFSNPDYLDLYPVYSDLASVSFEYYWDYRDILDSIALNSIQVPDVYEKDVEFLGWSVHSDFSTIDLSPEVESITYADIVPYLAMDPYRQKVTFYPVYKGKISDYKLYEYNTNEQMAEIHIDTENGIRIDDRSLINPNEHKGKNGEIPVYDYVGATISVTNCEEEYVLNNVTGKVKVRGNYTSTYNKKPIRIKFDSKQSLLGVNKDNKYKSWVLLAGWKDSSLLRDAVAYYIGNCLLGNDNLYSSGFRFVKVYLNGRYNGVYLLAEQQQIGPTRVNIPESKEETDSVKTGYFLEFDGYYKNEPDLQKFTIDFGKTKTGNNGFTVTNDIMNVEQHDFIKKVIQNIWKVIEDAMTGFHIPHKDYPYHTIDENGDYIEDKTIEYDLEAIERVVDVDSLIDMYILHELCQDRDIGWSSFYMSIDFSENGNKKLTFQAPWDFDYAMGNNTYLSAMTASLKDPEKMLSERKLSRKGWNQYTLFKDTDITEDDLVFKNVSKSYCYDNDNPFFSIMKDAYQFRSRVYTKWKNAQASGVFDGLLNMVETYSTLYEDEFNENFALWSNSMGLKLDTYQPDIVASFSTHKQACQYLKIWLEKRIEGLEELFLENIGIGKGQDL